MLTANRATWILFLGGLYLGIAFIYLLMLLFLMNQNTSLVSYDALMAACREALTWPIYLYHGIFK